MKIQDSLDVANFVQLAEILEELGYHRPVKVATDHTVCVEALGYHGGFLVGAEGGGG